jgi:hypothetical protein
MTGEPHRRNRRETNMIRKTRGRPLSSSRPFVEQCARIVARPGLIRAGVDQAPEWPGVTLFGRWLGDSGEQFTVNIEVIPTPQRLGGQRWWWQCPSCARRCGVLLSPRPDAPFACRLCWRATYLSDYPGRLCSLELRRLLGLASGGPFDPCPELERLTARRRRGVRRGRRVLVRAIRLLRKQVRAQTRTIGMLPRTLDRWF